MACGRELENKLQRELHDARKVRATGTEVAATCATGIAGRVVGSAIASDFIGICSPAGIIGRRTRIASQPGVFHVIEHVEGFRPEFKVLAFGHREMLDQCHIKIRAPRIAQDVSPGIAESESGWQHEHTWIEEKWTEPGQGASQRAAETPCFGLPTKSGYEPEVENPLPTPALSAVALKPSL